MWEKHVEELMEWARMGGGAYFFELLAQSSVKPIENTLFLSHLELKPSREAVNWPVWRMLNRAGLSG